MPCDAIRGLLLVLAGILPGVIRAADHPQFGQAWSRNMVSAETGLPDRFDIDSGGNIRWIVPLGTESHSTPVIADGRVYVGTNNGEPRDPRHVGDRGVLMCFSEADGRLLWQLVVPKREEDRFHDWPRSGISSPATVAGGDVYLVDNRGVVLCLDPKGLADGNDGPFVDEAAYFRPAGTNLVDVPPGLERLAPPETGPLDADIRWRFDLTTRAGIWSHDAAHTSILVHGDHLYLNTGTGVDNTHKKIRTPDAPSLVVLDRHTGEYLARDRENIAPRIFHCTWSSPSLGTIGGRDVVFFAGGDGVLYGFEPLPSGGRRSDEGPRALRRVWRYDCDPEAPKEEVHRYSGNKRTSPSNIYGMPVVLGDRIYVAGGGDWFWGKNEAWVQCLSAGGSGDVTATALRWSAPLGRHTMTTPAVADGLVYAADSQRVLHCIDADSGKSVWTQEVGGEVWASPMVADGKVYLGTRSGDFWILAAGRERRVLHHVALGAPISATAVAANGVVYVATMNRLIALKTP